MNKLHAYARSISAGLLLLLLSPLFVAAQAQDQGGGMWHTIRAADGTWQPIGNVKVQAGNPGYVWDVAAAGDNVTGNLHALAGTQGGGLWHTIRAANGTWQPFGNVLGQTGPGTPGNITEVASALIGCNLHVVVSTYSGDLFHTIRFCDGTWAPFGDIKGQAGNPGFAGDVSVAGNIGTGELHVVLSNATGGLWHTIRAANGTWQPFGDVTTQAGKPGCSGWFSFACSSTVGHVASALIGCNLHVVVSTDSGGLFHTIRSCNGSWASFGDIKVQAGNPGNFADVSIAGNADGELHVVASTGYQNGNGLWHTIRFASGTWQPFYDVGVQAGRQGQCGFGAVHTAFIGYSLHVVTDSAQCLQ
jgi:hypothetical protein